MYTHVLITLDGRALSRGTDAWIERLNEYILTTRGIKTVCVIGAGYEAIDPELKGLDPEDYPDIHKMAILADVAPYSREFHTYRQKVGSAAANDTELQIEYEKILDRVRQTRESVTFPSLSKCHVGCHGPGVSARTHRTVLLHRLSAVVVAACLAPDPACLASYGTYGSFGVESTVTSISMTSRLLNRRF
jgi:hypothetical protein